MKLNNYQVKAVSCNGWINLVYPSGTTLFYEHPDFDRCILPMYIKYRICPVKPVIQVIILIHKRIDFMVEDVKDLESLINKALVMERVVVVKPF